VNITEIDTNEADRPLEFTVRYANVELEGIKGRIIRNPNYGGPALSIYGWTWREDVSSHRKPLFQEALRDSIAAEGVRNPIVVYSTEEGDFASFGGSRLRAARDLELTHIPALVNDYSGRYDNCPEVTPDNVRQFFTDIPEYIEFTHTGVDTHYSLERNRRDHYDPAGMQWAEGADFIESEFSWIPTNDC
jgi:hypothetical protein